MAIRLVKHYLRDSLDLLNFKEEFDTIIRKQNIKNPFIDLNFLLACLDAIGSDEVYLVLLQEDKTLADFLVFKNSQGTLFRTPIPPEIPHFYNLSLLDKNPIEVIKLLKSEFDEFIITNVLLKKLNIELLKSQISGVSVVTHTYLKLQVPEDFERWLYKVRPKNQDMFNKILKDFKREKFNFVSTSDPFEVQYKVELALNKNTDMPILSKNLIATMLLQLKTVGFDLKYSSLTEEEWEIGAMLSFAHEDSEYLLFLWPFFEISKYELEDLLIVAALKELSTYKIKEIVVLQNVELKTIPVEKISVYDIYLSK